MNPRPFKFLPHKVKLTFSTKNGTDFVATYRVYDHTVTRKWLSLVQKSIDNASEIKNDGDFFGSAFTDANLLIESIKKVVISHNKYCSDNGLSDDFNIPITINNPPTQERLNELHEWYEKLIDLSIFSRNREANLNLQELNVSIHGLESVIVGKRVNHIEIIMKDFHMTPFSEEDYHFFSLDYNWGELLLSYGMTGVPTINAFNGDTHPVPQNSYCPGMIMIFWGDFKFSKHEELGSWLETRGLSINDPKSALGYIPLGVLEDVAKIDRESFIDKVSDCLKVKSVAIQHPEVKEELPVINKEARWPYDPEIFYNLDLVPYLDLDVTFDAKKLYEEAFRARDYFVTHREYDQKTGINSGKWKSLGLRTLFGDYTKTNYHTEYVFEGDPLYQNTPFAKLCPETMLFLNTITDISKCERIRFMLLEPGASIKTHRDSNRDVSFAVNISLNMPDECTFYAQLNADGTENPYTVKVPFKDSGSVILFNNAKYHKVENKSDKPRIHIIFHGPIRFEDKELVELCVKQNKMGERLNLIKKLMQKKVLLSEKLDNTKALLDDWVSAGLHSDTLPSNIALGIYDHKKYHPGENSSIHLHKRTLPTLFPLAYNLVPENEWDDYLAVNFYHGKEIVVLIGAGTFILNINKFISMLVSEVSDLLSSGWPAAGHLMDFNQDKILPYFHEQFIIVNLKVWDQIGRPKLGNLFSPTIGKFTCFVSPEYVHDTYTPKFIRTPKDYEKPSSRVGEMGWGSELIMAAVANNLGVKNISDNLRHIKRYSYPRDGLSYPKDEIEKLVKEKLSFSSKEIFYFNNEHLKIFQIPSIKANKFIFVSAGFKPFHIIKQYSQSSDPSVHFLDFSRPALDYIKKVSQIKNYEELKNSIVNAMSKDPLKKYSPSGAISILNTIVRDYFEGSEVRLIESIHKTQKATFEEANLVLEPHKLSSLLHDKDHFVIWISNVFYNNQLYLLMTKEEAEDALLKLVKEIAIKTNSRAFRLKETHNFVFGKGLDFIRGYLTDGSLSDSTINKASWNEVIF